jgi:hypothetical protein
MAGMADHDDAVTFLVVTLGLEMDLGDQGTGCIDDLKLEQSGFVNLVFRDAMGAEDGNGSLGDFVQTLNKNRAFIAQLVDYEMVVNDLVKDIDGGTMDLQRQIDYIDGSDDASAEPSGLSEYDFHVMTSRPVNVSKAGIIGL